MKSGTRGSLANIRLVALLRLMASLGRTAQVSATNGSWSLDVWFESGRVVEASCGSAQGMAALDCAAVLFPTGTFAILDGHSPSRTLDLRAADLNARLDELAINTTHIWQALPSLEATPRLRELSIGPTGEPIVVSGASLELLQAIDGRRTVAELIGVQHPVEDLGDLAEMSRAGVIRFGANPAPRGPQERDPYPPVPAHNGLVTPDGSDNGSLAAREAPSQPAPEARVRTPRWQLFRRVGLIATGLLGVIGALVVARILILTSRASSDLGVASLPTTVLSQSVQQAAPISATTPAALAPAGAPEPTLAVALPPPAQPNPTAAVAGPRAIPAVAVLIDTQFVGDHTWPSDPRSTAWIENGIYHLFARIAKEFVAIGPPSDERYADVTATATFQKIGGPPGGGYGLILRTQNNNGALDGRNQLGRYYVFEVGDNGEIGVWRRDLDHWRDLVPWMASPAVRTDTASNTLEVRAQGPAFTFMVNGTQVAAFSDTALNAGGVGIFVGGDGNEVLARRLTVRSID